MPNPYIKVAGVQKRWLRFFIKQGGVQLSAKRIYQKIAGVQTLIFLSGFDLVISADTTDYNMHNACISAGWNGTDPIIVRLTLNTGIYLRATSTAVAALRTGSFPALSQLSFLNLGIVQGKGGAGGPGGGPAGAGLPGGPAIYFDYDVTIDNTNGRIFGGAGGGAGGAGGTL